MAVNLNPYLNFREGSREVMEFYKGVFGGELYVMTFGENGMTGPGADMVMHSQLEFSGMTLMAADAPESMVPQLGTNGSISLSGGHAEQSTLTGYFSALADGGITPQPLHQAPWGDTFGMCIDRYGVTWMVNIRGDQG